MSGGEVTDDLTYLLYFFIAAWLSSVISEFTGLSSLLFYLTFGCILGNLEWVKHTPFLTSFGEFSIAIVLFALGFEENVSHFMEGIKKAWGIALIGAAVPFGVGFAFSLAFWPDLEIKAAMMGGLAVTATAVSLTMISLKSVGLATSKPAIGIMTSAVLDDIMSLALVAIMVPVAAGEADPTIEGIGWIIGKAALFFLCLTVAHTIVLPDEVMEGWLSHIPLVRTYGIRHMLKFNDGEQATLISLTFGLFFGMVAVWFGFHPAIGAYMSGLIMEESYFDIEDEGNTYQHTLHFIEGAAFQWLGPVFFLNLGASIIIEMEVLGDVIWYSLILFVGMFVGQFWSAALAARYVPGGFTWAESAMIGFGMLGRAELFFVVLNLCYVENDIMPKEMFFTFTFCAMLLNISVPVCITLYKPYYMRSKQLNPQAGSLRRSRTIERAKSFIQDTVFMRMAKKKEMDAERRVFHASTAWSNGSLGQHPQGTTTTMNGEGNGEALRGTANKVEDLRMPGEVKDIEGS
jgi:Kef-type K+ transport system membrane component KefB